MVRGYHFGDQCLRGASCFGAGNGRILSTGTLTPPFPTRQPTRASRATLHPSPPPALVPSRSGPPACPAPPSSAIQRENPAGSAAVGSLAGRRPPHGSI